MSNNMSDRKVMVRPLATVSSRFLLEIFTRRCPGGDLPSRLVKTKVCERGLPFNFSKETSYSTYDSSGSVNFRKGGDVKWEDPRLVTHPSVRDDAFNVTLS